MPESPGTSAAAPEVWRLARLSVLFVFDVARISRGEGDLLEPLLLTAILQANQAALPGRPDLQLAYGGTQWALPDAQRRPISISALAHSLGLPFETVRRRARALAARGLCVRTPEGLSVPETVVTSPAYLAVLTARAARLARLQAEAADAGLVAPAPGLGAFLAEAPRAGDRVLGDYMLRACEAFMEPTGSAMDGVVLLALCAGNLRDLDVTLVTGWEAYEGLLTPCRASALAEALGAPGETVRRHVLRLAEAGLAKRRRQGWIAHADPGNRPALVKIVERNAANLRRMLSTLAALAARESTAAARRA
jgi:DNA-binding Lrp family transcriptional regulator